MIYASCYCYCYIQIDPGYLEYAVAGSFDPRYQGNRLRSEVLSASDRGDSVSCTRMLRSDVTKKNDWSPRYRGSEVSRVDCT